MYAGEVCLIRLTLQEGDNVFLFGQRILDAKSTAGQGFGGYRKAYRGIERIFGSTTGCQGPAKSIHCSAVINYFHLNSGDMSAALSVCQ
jgi:hypothetical protein